jgi:hypothetical protein
LAAFLWTFPPGLKMVDSIVQITQDGLHGDRQPCGKLGLALCEGFQPSVSGVTRRKRVAASCSRLYASGMI